MRAITLITGDRVLLPQADGTRLVIKPGKGREQMTFLTWRSGKRLTVVPKDALPLLRAGQLDRRLFEVSTLLDFGYDDRRADLPVILTYADAGRASAGRVRTGARVGRALQSVNGEAVRVTRSQGSAFWSGLTTTTAGGRQRSLSAGVSKVWLDGLRKPTLDESVPQIGAPEAWNAGLTGTGVKVAVVDTGIDATHPDLAAQVIAEKNFTENPDKRDLVGHGTHVASTIAGTGKASSGRYKGVASGSKLLDAKVCEVYGCFESAILAGMEWAASNAKVVNMSLGGFDTPEVDPLEQAVNTLTAKYGTLFVIAAGNDGPQPGSVGSPGSADAALTVGAVDKSDRLAEFSSRGPRVGDGAIKPDVTAPGVDITAARGKDAEFGQAGQSYVALSGTSMATPHVAGSAAILAQQHPTWTPNQLKSALMGSAKGDPDLGPFEQGSGRVDLARGITQVVTTTPAAINFGGQPWPHRDDKPVSKKVTYHNDGAAPVSLKLAVQVNAGAKPTTGEVFRVNPVTLTVPAHGVATATVTADTSVPGPDAPVSAYLTADGGSQVVRTPLVVNKEVESYNLTLKHTDRAGKSTDQYGTVLIDLVGERDFVAPRAANGKVTMRLPKGRYVLLSYIWAGDFDAGEQSELIDPVLDFSRNQTVDLAARRAKPIHITVPRESSRQSFLVSQFLYRDVYTAFFSFNPENRMYTAQIGDQKPAKGALSLITGFWADPSPDFQSTDSPVTYSLLWYERDRMMTGLRKRVAQRDLATVRADVARSAVGPLSWNGAFGVAPGSNGAGAGWGSPVHTPFRRTDYFNNAGGVTWETWFREAAIPTDEDPFPDSVTWTDSLTRSYQPGKVYQERWNQAPFTPTFTRSGPTSSRYGSVIYVRIPLYGDAAGRAMFGETDRAQTTLYRNGTKVATSPDPGQGFFDVPATMSSYRLETSAERGAPSSLSTRVTAAWTFQSGDPGEEEVLLPLSVVRFTPKLDLYNSAPAGKPFSLPVSVQRYRGSAAAANKTLTVAVSYDDGRTWQPTVLTRASDGTWTAQLQHPNRAGFVSLRARAIDQSGNSVEQTIIHAYRIAR